MANVTLQRAEASQFDFEDEGHRLEGLAALAGWIERARDLTCALQAAAQVDPKLKELLGLHDIAYGDAYWQAEESNGLRRLLTQIWSSATAMREAGMTTSRMKAATPESTK